MVGLPRGEARVVPYRSEWPRLFAAEAERIRAALRNLAPTIEHGGSTAVPGLAAKPIVDMLVAVPRLAETDEAARLLAEIGYERRPNGDLRGRRVFVLGPPDDRRFHLSLAEPGSPFWRDHVRFRDRLRAHPEIAAEYARLKQALAARYPQDRASYTDGKDAFIGGVLVQAAAE